MIKINEVVIVEGKYDKIKLDSLIDAVIVYTDGFAIFKDKKKLAMLRSFAKKKGILILTDSDMAGFKIRGYINSCIGGGSVKNAFIPDILGKEKRKRCFSKEGKVGVEGMDGQILLNALKNAGIRVQSPNKQQSIGNNSVKKVHLYEDKVIGSANSKQIRDKLLEFLSLPERTNSNLLLDVLNTLYGYDEYKNIIEKIKN